MYLAFADRQVDAFQDLLVAYRGAESVDVKNNPGEFQLDENCVELPSYEEFCTDKTAIMRQTKIVEQEMNPWCGRRLIQRTNGRILLVEPPRPPMTPEEFDHFSELPFTGVQHWSYKEKIPAWETVKDSITATALTYSSTRQCSTDSDSRSSRSSLQR